MATILQRLTRALSPTVIRETAKTAGLEPELASLGFKAAGPVVVLALADKAAMRDGPETVFRMLPSAGSPMRGELAFIAPDRWHSGLELSMNPAPGKGLPCKPGSVRRARPLLAGSVSGAVHSAGRDHLSR